MATLTMTWYIGPFIGSLKWTQSWTHCNTFDMSYCRCWLSVIEAFLSGIKFWRRNLISKNVILKERETLHVTYLAIIKLKDLEQSPKMGCKTVQKYHFIPYKNPHWLTYTREMSSLICFDIRFWLSGHDRSSVYHKGSYTIYFSPSWLI